MPSPGLVILRQKKNKYSGKIQEDWGGSGRDQTLKRRFMEIHVIRENIYISNSMMILPKIHFLKDGTEGIVKYDSGSKISESVTNQFCDIRQFTFQGHSVINVI